MTILFEELFSGNLFAGVIISVIVIISYTNFSQNQQMFLIYLLLYGLAASSVVPIRVCVVLFILASFIFLEYLTEDSKKLEYITSAWKKSLDYSFLLVFQFHVVYYALSIVALAFSRRSSGWMIWCLRALSFMLLFVCEHQTITQPFKVKTITQIAKPFLEHPFYSFRWSENAEQRYKMLCRFEDKTFLCRKTYTIASPEYIKMTFTLEKMRKLIISYQQKKKDDTLLDINNRIDEQKSKLKKLEDKEELVTSISKTLEKMIEALSLSVAGNAVNYRLSEMYESNRTQRTKNSEYIEKERRAINKNIFELNKSKEKFGPEIRKEDSNKEEK